MQFIIQETAHIIGVRRNVFMYYYNFNYILDVVRPMYKFSRMKTETCVTSLHLCNYLSRSQEAKYIYLCGDNISEQWFKWLKESRAELAHTYIYVYQTLFQKIG